VRNNEPKRLHLLWLLIAALAIVMVVFSVSYAQQDHTCQGGHNCNDDGTVSVSTGSVSTGSTNVSTGGNRSLALVNNMGDVDISDCLGSTQFGTPLFSKQKLVLNQVCMAEFYLSAGKYELAAMSLCNVPEIIAEFSTEAECEMAHDFKPVYEAVVVEDDHYEAEEEWHQEQQMLQQDYDERIAQLENQVSEPPRVTRQVVQEPWLNEDKRARLRAEIEEEE